MDVVDRLVEAVNRHDIDEMVACFADDYQSAQPAHPARGFGGPEQVRENWSMYFREVPDIHLEVLARARSKGAEWMEVRIRGTRADGSSLDLAGVIVNEVDDDRIRSARLYVEEVEEGGADVRDAVRRWATGR